MKIAKLAALAFIASVIPSSAITYLVDGIINSSGVWSLDSEAPVTLQFDYNPATVGADADPSPIVSRYYSGISNVTLTIGSVTYSVTPQELIVIAATGSLDQIVVNTTGAFPAIEGYIPTSGQFSFSNFTGTLTSDAAPADLAAVPWEFGSFFVEYQIMEDSDLINYAQAEGTFDMSSLRVVSGVPEPSAALLGGLGMLALLRRRRV